MARPVLLISLLAVLVYAPGLGGGFLYDDEWLLVDNPWLAKGSLGEAFTTNFWPFPPPNNWRAINYRPLGTLGHWALYRIFGLSPFAFHAASILLHAAATVAVFFLLTGLGFRVTVAATVGALFAVHPLHVEAVAWMSQLTETMAGACLLGALALFAHGRRAFSLLLGSAAVFSKETALGLPALVFVLAAHQSRGRGWVRSALRASLPYALLAVVWFAARSLLLPRFSWPHLAQEAMNRAGVIVAAAAHYLRVLFVPWPLAPQYELPGVWAVIAAGLVGALWFWAALLAPGQCDRAARDGGERPRPACCLRHGLGLALGLAGWPLVLPVATAPLLGRWIQVQDRYAYVAVSGACLAVVLLLEQLPRPRFLLVSVLLVAACAMGTLRQVSVWDNAEALWSHTLTVTPTSKEASLALGYTLFHEARFAEAEQVYRRALAYHPGDAELVSCLKATRRAR